MGLIKISSSHNFKGSTLNSGTTYRLRAREVEEIVKNSKGDKV